MKPAHLTSPTLTTRILGLFVILMLPLLAHAQVAGGSIAGRVTDSNGALIPGAQVAIRNTATGVTTNLVANEEGVYRAPNLLPGNYEITASAPNAPRSLKIVTRWPSLMPRGFASSA